VIDEVIDLAPSLASQLPQGSSVATVLWATDKPVGAGLPAMRAVTSANFLTP